MAYLTGDQITALSQSTVRLHKLVHFDFDGDPRWYWDGFGTLKTLDGQEWEGAKGVGVISGLGASSTLASTNLSFTLSGTDPRIIALARDQSGTVKGRDVTVMLQLANADWTLAGAPIHVATAEMDVMTYTMSPLETGGHSYTVTVTAEDFWSTKRRAPFGSYSDRDQKGRFAGDRAFEFVAILAAGKTITWAG